MNTTATLTHLVATPLVDRPETLRAPRMVSNVGGLYPDEIRAAAPSVFAGEAHSSRSRKFGFVNTASILETLAEVGFVPVYALQAKTKIDGMEPYTRHRICLRPASELGTARLEAIELELTNAHNGTSAYRVGLRIYRLVCSNGLKRWVEEGTQYRVPHLGDLVSNVVEGSITILEEREAIAGEVEAMKARVLSREEQEELARRALALRFPQGQWADGMHFPHSCYLPEDVLRPQIAADAAEAASGQVSLWLAFNLIQRNLVAGGVSRVANGKRRVVRAIRGMDQGDGFNQALWRLAMEVGFSAGAVVSGRELVVSAAH